MCKLFSPYILCLFNLMRYASFFILHLKAFFSRSFLSISLDAMWAREHFKFMAKERLCMRCDSMYFQFSVLSLLHSHSRHTHTEGDRHKKIATKWRKNRSFFCYYHAFATTRLCLSCKFSFKTWKLMAWDSLPFRYVWFCILLDLCFSYLSISDDW